MVQVYEVEDDGEKIGVEAYLLRKISQGSTSASISTCLQMGPLSRSKVSCLHIQNSGTHTFVAGG